MTSSGLEPQASVAAEVPQDVSADGHRRPSSPVLSGAGTTGRQGEPLATSPSPGVAPDAASRSRSSHHNAGGVSAQSLREAEQAWFDSRDTTTSCLFCDWTHEGTALECREEAMAHREREHPEACIRKPRRRGSRMRKRALRTASEEEQVKVDTEEARRVRSEREQAEMLAKIERGRERAALAALDGVADSV